MFLILCKRLPSTFVDFNERFFGDDKTYSLAADLEYFTGFLLGRDHRGAFFQFMNHWLFTIYMLTFIHGINGNTVMPVISGGDNDRIDILAVQNFLIIFCGE